VEHTALREEEKAKQYSGLKEENRETSTREFSKNT